MAQPEPNLGKNQTGIHLGPYIKLIKLEFDESKFCRTGKHTIRT